MTQGWRSQPPIRFQDPAGAPVPIAAILLVSTSGRSAERLDPQHRLSRSQCPPEWRLPGYRLRNFLASAPSTDGVRTARGGEPAEWLMEVVANRLRRTGSRVAERGGDAGARTGLHLRRTGLRGGGAIVPAWTEVPRSATDHTVRIHLGRGIARRQAWPDFRRR